VEVKAKLNRVYEDGDDVGRQNFINFFNYVKYGTPDPEDKIIDITPEAEDEDER
jgi:hypothetical protein